MTKDHLDMVLEQWQSVRPDLDCSNMGIVGRVRRAGVLFDKSLKELFAKHNLSLIEFDILATLRRSDQALTPTELYQTLMLSSGAMSTRIEQLVQQGLLERQASNGDRRSNKVQITQTGIDLVDTSLLDHLENMDNLLSGLDRGEREQLAHLLRKMGA
ncbi:MarR family winged helix-turn-helix transcriptional regulator [Vibrio sonorensis]|uniref:MarR family winged helix-turn-helix transcriptional regulator n=1 Tax=Vibrio sonorensis TaxID=1004316 RepID=UPI0008DB0414|nr:MarR family transcriptional regulator [Vibrio sonorensis]